MSDERRTFNALGAPRGHVRCAVVISDEGAKVTVTTFECECKRVYPSRAELEDHHKRQASLLATVLVKRG